MAQTTLEGTWEEVAPQAGDLSGRRVRLTILDDEEERIASTLQKLRELDEVVQKHLDIRPLPPEAFERDSLYEGHY